MEDLRKIIVYRVEKFIDMKKMMYFGDWVIESYYIDNCYFWRREYRK